MRVDEMLKDYKEWGKGDLGAIIRAAKFVEDQNQDLHDTLAQVTEENERLRHGITAIIEGDKGDEPLETADQVVSLLEGLLAALEEQEFKDSAS